MNKQTIITAMFALVAMTGQAQGITGRVIDEQSQPMPFANVVLLNRIDSIFIVGAVTKEAHTTPDMV